MGYAFVYKYTQDETLQAAEENTLAEQAGLCSDGALTGLQLNICSTGAYTLFFKFLNHQRLILLILGSFSRTPKL